MNSNNITIRKDEDFKNEMVSSVPLYGNNNITTGIDNQGTYLKKNEIGNIKPMLSRHSNSIVIPDNRKVKIKPMLHKKVPANSFSMMANSKKGSGSHSQSDGDSFESDGEEDDGYETSEQGDRVNRDDDSEDESDDDDAQSDAQSDAEDDTEDDAEDEAEDDDSDDDDAQSDDDEQSDAQSDESDVQSSRPPKKTYEQIQQEKQDYLFKLDRLDKSGYPPSKKYSMASSYEDILFEYKRLKKQKDTEANVLMYRYALMVGAMGVEKFSNTYESLGIRLDGWTEHLQQGITYYDEMFEEMGEKYGNTFENYPVELRLGGVLIGSAIMYHWTNKKSKRGKPPMSQESAQKSAEEKVEREFGGSSNIIGNFLKSGIQQASAMKSESRPMPQAPMRPPPNLAFQQKLKEPNIDDILNELNDSPPRRENNNPFERSPFGDANARGTPFGDDDALSVKSGASTINIKNLSRKTKTGNRRGIELDLR